MRKRPWLVAVTSLALLGALVPAPATSAASTVQVVLDGKVLALNPAPIIQNDRTLVPLRGVVEAMGAVPTWDGTTRTVEVQRGEKYLKLQIDRRLACLTPDCTDGALLDVPATIIDNRTYVPVRFIATSLGVDVAWDNAARAVLISTTKPPTLQAPTVLLEGVTRGQQITGPVSLKASGTAGTQVLFYLVDSDTRKARLIGAGADIAATYTYTPDPADAGPGLIVAAIRDAYGIVRYSNTIPVTVAPNTQLSLTGIEPNGTITGPITLGHQINFAASRVVYRLLDPSGQSWDMATTGPTDTFTWYPPVSFNGPKQVQVLAYDRNETEYASAPVPVVVNSDYRTSFSSIEQGDVLTYRGKWLSVAANYDIASVRYLLDGQLLVAQQEYWWTYGPEANGAHTLTVEVTDGAGTVRTVGPISFTIDAHPGLWLYGVGPEQVVTEPLSLLAMPNVPADRIRYYLREGGRDTLLGEKPVGQELAWNPTSSGWKVIYAQAWQGGQWKASTEPVSFRVYLGTTYGPRPLVERSQFKDLIAPMAVKSRQETGMSAALQVAQAILETGWGQYVPVDKYTGQFSNNLFGMKGTGSAGSIISTTWEVYNGERYVVDDAFRAYYNVAENWRDHKDLLLTRSWYAPFRAVMTDPVLGAWGLKRSGYATDPQYPVKLISIMRSQDLFKLDEVEL